MADKTCLAFRYLQVSFEWDAASKSTTAKIAHLTLSYFSIYC